MGKGNPDTLNGANFWEKWERPAHVEFFPGEGEGFSVGCGIRIFGGMSRMYEKKSLSLWFRDCYGAASLQYPVFANREFTRYETLLLRTSGQDRLRTIMKDAMTTSLAEGLLDVQAYRPVILYLNGEYWGIHYFREKLTDDYVAAHYNVSPESVDLLQGDVRVNAGSRDDYMALIEFVKGHDMRDAANYRYVTERMDVQNYADYIIAEIYCGNDDTGNIRFYRSSEGDNKWRWILFDTDLGFQPSIRDRFWYNLNPAGTGTGQQFSTTLITNLLKNSDFLQLFAQRLEYNMKNTWSTARVLARIDEFHDLLQPEIARNFQKWNSKITASQWEANVESLRVFARGRQATLKKELLTDSRVKKLLPFSDAQIAQFFE